MARELSARLVEPELASTHETTASLQPSVVALHHHAAAVQQPRRSGPKGRLRTTQRGAPFIIEGNFNTRIEADRIAGEGVQGAWLFRFNDPRSIKKRSNHGFMICCKLLVANEVVKTNVLRSKIEQ